MYYHILRFKNCLTCDHDKQISSTLQDTYTLLWRSVRRKGGRVGEGGRERGREVGREGEGEGGGRTEGGINGGMGVMEGGSK